MQIGSIKFNSGFNFKGKESKEVKPKCSSSLNCGCDMPYFTPIIEKNLNFDKISEKMQECGKFSQEIIEEIKTIIRYQPEIYDVALKMLEAGDFPPKYFISTLYDCENKNKTLALTLLNLEKFPKGELKGVLRATSDMQIDEIEKLSNKIKEYDENSTDTDLATHIHGAINSDKISNDDIKMYKNWIKKVQERIDYNNVVPYCENLHGNLDELREKGLITRKKLNGKRTNWVISKNEKAKYRYLNISNERGEAREVTTGLKITSRDDAKLALAYILGDEMQGIIRLLNLIGEDGTNQILDRGIQNLLMIADETEGLSADDMIFAKDLYKNVKSINKSGEIVDVSPKQKIEILDLLFLNSEIKKARRTPLDIENYKRYIAGTDFFKLDFQTLNAHYLINALKASGVNKENLAHGLNTFNYKYGISVYRGIRYEGSSTALRDILKSTVAGEFEYMINDPTTRFGLANENTKRAFKNCNLNFKIWDKYPKSAEHFNLTGEKLSIKMWDRDPKKSLFDGNQTTCCAAIGVRADEAMPSFLVNKAINLIEIRNNRDEVVATSRIFMAKIDGEPSCVIEGIEASNSILNSYLATDEAKKKLRDTVISYVKEVCKNVSAKDDTPIYFATKYSRIAPSDKIVSEDGREYWRDLYDLLCNKKLELIGDISTDRIYLNCTGRVYYSDIFREGEKIEAKFYKLQ